MPHYLKTVPITNLLLSVDNPRFDIVNNQREAILSMIEDQKEKLFNLAKDIVEAGLNPSDVPIVTPEATDENRFIVLEGNRRITALKLLIEPSLIPNQNNSLVNKFRDISKNFNASGFNEIACAVFDDEQEAYRWIELKHTGENQGIGTVGWDGTSVERFKERRGKSSITLKVMDFVKHKGNLDIDTQNKIDSMPITNLGRLLGDPNVRDFLGIDFVDGVLYSNYPDEEVLKGLTRMVKDIVHRKINVNNIRTKKDRSNYIEGFSPSDIPDKSKMLNKSAELGKGNHSPSTNLKNNNKVTPLNRSKALSTSRKRAIPSNFVIHISEKRINDIYRELKTLDVDEFPNSVSILLRVFLELSLDYYIDHKGITTVTNNDKLVKKVQTIAEYFKNNNILDKYQLKPISVALASTDQLLSTDTLNSYVHNRNVQPIPNALKMTWDNMEIFMKTIWTT